MNHADFEGTRPLVARSRALAMCALLAAAPVLACDEDPVQPSGGGDAREYAVVLNSTGLSLTVFPVAQPDSTRTIALGPSGTPPSLAVRGDVALVPLGVVSAVAVVALDAGVVLHTIPLPANGGATGVVIANDSVAFVGNPELNSVSPVMYRKGSARPPIPVGVYPHALEIIGDRVFVLEANLANFTVQGPSSISVIDAHEFEVAASFPLSGRNAGDAVVSGDSVLYVLNWGDWGEANGSLSIIEQPLAAEAEHATGFGAGTSRLVLMRDGRLAVSSFVNGIAIYDPATRAFVVAPENGIVPETANNILAMGTDAAGRLYIVNAGDCVAPGSVVRLRDDYTAAATATVGSCPNDIAFTTF